MDLMGPTSVTTSLETMRSPTVVWTMEVGHLFICVSSNLLDTGWGGGVCSPDYWNCYAECYDQSCCYDYSCSGGQSW